MRLFEKHDEVELFRDVAVVVVAPAFRLRAVDDP